MDLQIRWGFVHLACRFDEMSFVVKAERSFAALRMTRRGRFGEMSFVVKAERSFATLRMTRRGRLPKGEDIDAIRVVNLWKSTTPVLKHGACGPRPRACRCPASASNGSGGQMRMLRWQGQGTSECHLSSPLCRWPLTGP